MSENLEVVESTNEEVKVNANEKLRLQCIEGKKEIRRLAKVIEDLQNQLTVTQNRLCYSDEKLLRVVSAGEVLQNSKGEEYVIVTKNYFEEIESERKKIQQNIYETSESNLNKREMIEMRRQETDERMQQLNEKDERRLQIEKQQHQLKDMLKEVRQLLEQTECALKEEMSAMKDEKKELKKLLQEKVNQAKFHEENGDEIKAKINEKNKEIEDLKENLIENARLVDLKQNAINASNKESNVLRLKIKDIEIEIEEKQREIQEHKDWLEQLKFREIATYKEKDEQLEKQKKKIEEKNLKLAEQKEIHSKLDKELKNIRRRSLNWK
ncbi:calponin homology domain-containing protein DDB_G0272472 [Hydra vulgaris]|uniref:calponin homology domain-containing protein DDB_G0272472 n=1 Tax=Hydra vulgaris TaxID=6087 RepID=UPI001F5F90A0|nr:calponin homology domain-containing protein DDB_G0272472 [Hydra vulgaris]